MSALKLCTLYVHTCLEFPDTFNKNILVCWHTASADSDYTPESGDLTFSAGSTRNCITIKITSDSVDEGDEIIQLQLTTQSGVTLGPHTSTDVTITETETVIAGGGGDGGGDGGDGGGDKSTPSTGGTVGVRDSVSSIHNSLSLLFLILAAALAVLNTQ